MSSEQFVGLYHEISDVQTADIPFPSASAVSSPVFSLELSERMLDVDTRESILQLRGLLVADL